MFGLACQHRADFHFLNRGILDFLRDFFRDFFTRFHNQLAGLRMIYIIDRGPTQDSFIQGFDHFVVLLQSRRNQPTLRMAIFFGNNHILRHIHQPTGQVPGIGSLQSGIGKTLTGTVGRDEVLQYRQTFLEVRENRVFDDFAPACPGLLRLCHKATHTAKLTNLFLGTTSPGIQHHENRIEALAVGRKLVHHRIGQLIVSMCPDIDNLVVTLVVGDETHVVVVHHFFHVRIGFGNQFFLHLRNNHIAQVERKTALVSCPVTHALDIIQELHRLGIAALLQNIGNDITQRFLGQQGIDETVFLRHHLVEEDTSHRRFKQVRSTVLAGQTDLDPGMHIHLLLVESDNRFLGRIENRAFALHFYVSFALAAFGQVIQTQDHILGRNSDRRPVGRIQNIMRSQHQQLGFQNGGVAQRHMDSHLVAIEVRVECGTAQGVQTHRLAFDQLGLECLDTQTVQSRGAVHQNRMPFQYVFKDVPDHGILAFHDFLGRFHGLHDTAFQHLANDERLEQFRRHILGKPHLVHLQIRAYHDDRTAGIVDTLTEQVLTETALLPFQAVGQGLQHASPVAFGGTSLAGIIEQGIHGFLQHTLFIAHDHIRSLDFYQFLQTVVANDDPTIQVVQIRCSEPASIQGNQRTQIRRNDRNHLHDHPFRTVFHPLLRIAESLHHVQTLQSLLLALLGSLLVRLVAQLVRQGIQINLFQQVVKGFPSHLGDELVGIIVIQQLVFYGKAVHNGIILFIGKELELFNPVLRLDARLDYHVLLVIDNRFQLFGLDTQQSPDFIRQRTEKPDMGNRHDKLDMPHPLAANFLLRHFHPAAIAHDTLVTDSFVLTAMTLPVLGRPEDTLAEKAIAFRLVCTVINRLRFRHFAMGTFQNGLGRCQTDSDFIEVQRNRTFFSRCHIMNLNCILKLFSAVNRRERSAERNVPGQVAPIC